ncbi:MAG: O-acetylhomoserine aminocarboxypropyltransferase/cysteine synthase [Acidobacteria bacterium]|nr:O-acetylhomoserine aminocarboxypropyltransferase/cysteine synthase [Acidobacteriota bacterium]
MVERLKTLLERDHIDRILEADIEAQEKQREFVCRRMKDRFDTICVLGAYSQDDAYAFKSIVPCASMSVASPFQSAEEAAAVLAYKIPGYVYTRIVNPTNYLLELTLAMLDGYDLNRYSDEIQTSALTTSSGMAAIFTAVTPFLHPGCNFVSSNKVYGGTYMQFDVELRQLGAECRWVENPGDLSEWKNSIDDGTRFMYVETPSNPGLFIADIPALADLAHSNGIPLIVDSTIATPVLMRPLSLGADIVVHSLSKAMTGSARAIGGALVSRKNIVTKEKNAELRADFATWVRKWPYRDIGACMSPANAERTLDEIRTLRHRIKTMSHSALRVAEFLRSHPKILRVNYPGLPSHPQHDLARREMVMVDEEPANAFSYLMSFDVKGSVADANRVVESMRIGYHTTHLGSSCTIRIQPSCTTHLQQGEEARRKAGIGETQVRYSVGLEATSDIIRDIDQALATVS